MPRFLFFLLPLLPVAVQDSLPAPPNPEPLALHFDKPFYVAGEEVWYSVYFLNPDTAVIPSRVVHLLVYGPEGALVKEQQLRRSGRTAAGDFHIPLDWREGYYQIQIYTRWNLNFPNFPVLTVRLPIYGLGKGGNEGSKNKAGPAEPNPLPETALQIKLQTDSGTYRQKSRVKLQVETFNAGGVAVPADLSVVVVEANQVPGQGPFWHSNPRKPAIAADSLRYRPERQIALSARIKSGQSSIMSAHSVENNAYYQLPPHTQEVELSSGTFYGSRTFQILDLNPYTRNVPEVQLVPPVRPQPPTPVKAAPPRDARVSNYLEHYRKRLQFRRVFPARNPQEQLKSRFLSHGSLPSLPAPNKSYNPGDYTGLTTLQDFIDAVVLRARVRATDDGPQVRLYNSETNDHFPNDPVYLINGFLCVQQSEVLAMGMSDIQSIDLYTDRATLFEHFDSNLAGNGIIALQTRDRLLPAFLRYADNQVKLQGYYQARNFGDRPVPYPDFRPVVFWQLQLSTSGEHPTTFTFTTSDAVGRFLIKVVAVSSEGLAGWRQAEYEVVMDH